MRIVELSDAKSLYCWYYGQSSPQDCYIELDCASAVLRADYNGEIGNAVPFSVWHGHDRRYRIPCLTASAANALMERIAPFAERVVAGYERVWDGHNNVARFSDDALTAEEEIEELCTPDNFNEYEQIQVWDASEWFSGGLEVPAESTNEQLSEMAAGFEAELDSNVIVVGIKRYLENRRNVAGEEVQV